MTNDQSPNENNQRRGKIWKLEIGSWPLKISYGTEAGEKTEHRTSLRQGYGGQASNSQF